MIGAEMQKIAT